MTQKELFLDKIINDVQDLQDRNIPIKAKEQLEEIANLLEEIDIA